MMLTKEQLKIKKCLKSYLTAKKYYDNDLEKSYEYLKQCMKILNDLKDQRIYQEYANIIDETETECSKYLTYAIEKTLDKPIIINMEASFDKNELFDTIEKGNISKLKNFKYGQIDFKINNEEGLTPLHYAIKFGDLSFLKQSFKLGAQIDQTNNSGHTLLEYACLEKDPNMINFLINYGADMKKHLKLRESKKYFNNGNQIDIILLEKIIMEKIDKYNDLKYLSFALNYIKEYDKIDLGYCELNNSTILKKNISNKDLIKKLDNYLDTIDLDSRNTYLKILKEELSNDLSYKLGCPTNKLEIILYNLVPFIDFNENLRLNWLVSLEIKYLILKILKNKVRINIKQLKSELSELLYISYIKPEIIPEGFIEIIVLQLVSKIKV